MAYSDETRRYLAKVSRVGIVWTIVYALLYGVLHFFLVPSKYADGFSLSDLFLGKHNVFPEITVTAVGLLALTVGGILSLMMKAHPDVVDQGWIVGGKAVLLAAPFGYIQSLGGMTHLLTAVSTQTDFVFSFATLATVFVGYALGTRRISVNQPFLHVGRKAYTLRVLKNTAMAFGVMLVSILLMIGQSWLTYGEAFSQQSMAMQMGFFVLEPLHAAAPVALAVILGYPLLSIAARWNACSHGKLFGKGTLLLGWVTLGAAALDHGLSVAGMVITAGRLTSDLFAEAYRKITDLQAMNQVISHVATILGIWTLCLLLPALGRSKPALWGARGLLGIVVLRKLSMWILEVMGSMYQLKAQSGSGVGTIGGGSMSLTVFTIRAQSWLSMIFTVLSIAALVVLTVGLTRHLRVSKAFWWVPVLTAATTAASLMVSVIRELILRIADDPAVILVSVVSTAIAAILYFIRSLVGILVLSRATTDDVPPVPRSSAVVEPPKMLLPNKRSIT